MREQQDVRHRVGAHGKIDRAHDGHARINRKLHLRIGIGRDVEVCAELRQMLSKVCVDLALQYAIRPVGRRNRQADERTVKDLLDARKILPHHGFHLGRHAIDLRLDGDRLHAVGPRHERDLHARRLARHDLGIGHRIADEDFVEDLANENGLFRGIRRRHVGRLAEQELPCNRLDARLHAGGDG